MKKLFSALTLTALLTGCSVEQTNERVEQNASASSSVYSEELKTLRINSADDNFYVLAREWREETSGADIEIGRIYFENGVRRKEESLFLHVSDSAEESSDWLSGFCNHVNDVFIAGGTFKFDYDSQRIVKKAVVGVQEYKFSN